MDSIDSNILFFEKYINIYHISMKCNVILYNQIGTVFVCTCTCAKRHDAGRQPHLMFWHTGGVVVSENAILSSKVSRTPEGLGVL